MTTVNFPTFPRNCPDPAKADPEAITVNVGVDTKAAVADFDFLLGKLDELRGKAKATYEKAVAERRELKSRSREIVKSIRELTVEQAQVEAKLAQSKLDLNTNYGPWPLPHHIPSFDAKVASAVTETADEKMEEITRILSERFGWELDTSRLEVKPLTAEEIDLAVAEGDMKIVNFPTGGFACGGHTKGTSELIRPGETIVPLTWPGKAGQRNAERNKPQNFQFKFDDKVFTSTPEQMAQFVEAYIENLRAGGDRETLTALFRLSSAALTAMRFQEALGKTATGKPGDDKSSEHF